MDQTATDERIAAVRRFNRFYTRRIGALGDGHLGNPFSLTEARVVYELAQRGSATASELGEALGLDAGYLSRILRRFQERGLIGRTPSDRDGRRSILRLTEEGREAFARLNASSARDVGEMLAGLAEDEQRRLVAAMETVEKVLGGAPEGEPYLLRTHQPGDMGWIVHRHGVLYWREYGWDERFEGLVAEVVADFIASFDPRRERCWIAERDGEIVGSVFLVKHPEREGVCKLRLLYVEPRARGHGIGARLVRECIRFARQAGYARMTLWTNSVLVSARRIYEAEGFQLVAEEPHHSFGKDLVAQTWERDL